MTDTPDEHAPGTDVDCDSKAIDIGLKLAGLPVEILLQLAETLGDGNPLALLVSKAHLSKAFCGAARDALGLVKQLDLGTDEDGYCEWTLTPDAAAVFSKCSQLSSLRLGTCRNAAVVAVA